VSEGRREGEEITVVVSLRDVRTPKQQHESRERERRRESKKERERHKTEKREREREAKKYELKNEPDAPSLPLSLFVS
jgi:hypothetical protein